MHENNLYKLPPEDLGGATRNPQLVVQTIQVNNNRRAPVADLHESIAVSAPPALRSCDYFSLDIHVRDKHLGRSRLASYRLTA